MPDHVPYTNCVPSMRAQMLQIRYARCVEQSIDFRLWWLKRFDLNDSLDKTDWEAGFLLFPDYSIVFRIFLQIAPSHVSIFSRITPNSLIEGWESVKVGSCPASQEPRAPVMYKSDHSAKLNHQDARRYLRRKACGIIWQLQDPTRLGFHSFRIPGVKSVQERRRIE